MKTGMVVGITLVAALVGGVIGWTLQARQAPVMDPAAMGAHEATQVPVVRDGMAAAPHAGHDMSGTTMGHDMMAEWAKVDRANPAALDNAFAVMMIPHHEQAVQMAQDQLQYGENADLKNLSQTIIQSQQAEIEFLRGWVNSHGGVMGSGQAVSVTRN